MPVEWAARRVVAGVAAAALAPARLVGPPGAAKSRSAFSEGVGMSAWREAAAVYASGPGEAPLAARAAQQEEGDAQVEQVPARCR